MNLRSIFTASLCAGALVFGSVPGPAFSVPKAEGIAAVFAQKPYDQKDGSVFLNADGMTLETRINPPEGYTRVEAEEGSLQEFVRKMEMKEDGSEVLLYTGKPKPNQDDHAAVFALDVGSENLQQCADSIMRVYSEYLWEQEEYDKIRFHLTNGFLMEYTKWRDGYRLQVNGNTTKWKKTAGYDDSYECFRDYLRIVYCYAGTISLNKESEEIETDEMEAGDMLIYAGSPGHAVMIADTAVNEDGDLCFLLAQSSMPAQEFHILKNPANEDETNPWYYASELTFPFSTPKNTFQEGNLRRWSLW